MPETAASPSVWTGARLRGAPRVLSFSLLGLESLALALTVIGLVTAHPSTTTFLRFGTLVGLCLVFEEIALQAGKLRLLVSTGPQPDMTSVWTFAGALVLPAGYAALLAILISVDIWIRRQKATGQYLYRKVYSAATIVLACLTTTAVRSFVEQRVSGIPSGLVTLIAIVAAAIVYTAVNRLLIILAARLANPQARLPIIGSWGDNALELATLCLAAMSGVVLQHEPALCVLILLPMVLLQRGALVKQLETAATIDAKTGLLNAAVWQEAARRELARADREETTAALLVIDLDHFKTVNDTYGHLVGDAALFAVGTRLHNELRQSDMIGRFGGEEFVALLVGVSNAEAMATAERVRAAIASIHLSEITTEDADTADLTLTVSVGLALFPEHETGLDALMRVADSALYQAKRAGRNQVRLAAVNQGRDTH
ncbi:MAG TPA: GGDEF domain-containing protein [Jatrophihabitans sp.]|jgi:diguanylate cyclase (GGDEF)-like protein